MSKEFTALRCCGNCGFCTLPLWDSGSAHGNPGSLCANVPTSLVPAIPPFQLLHFFNRSRPIFVMWLSPFCVLKSSWQLYIYESSFVKRALQEFRSAHIFPAVFLPLLDTLPLLSAFAPGYAACSHELVNIKHRGQFPFEPPPQSG